MGTRPKLPWASLHEVVASKQPIMEPGSPEMKRFRDLPNRSLNGALKDETRQVVELSEVATDFIQSLATAEKDHSNKLSQIVKEFRKKTKTKRWSDLFTSSTQFVAWEALLSETEQEAQCCMWYSKQLERDVKKQLHELTTKKEPLRKKWFEIHKAYLARVDKEGKHVQKLFEDYQSQWKDYAKCVGKQGASDYEKHSVVLHSYNAHNEYVMQLSAFNALHEEFYSKQIYDMLDELQALQEQAVEGFQTCMQKQAQLSRDKLDTSLRNHTDSSFPEKLKNINASADISSFVSGQNVGSEIYPPPKCDFRTPKLNKTPASDLPTLSNALQWIELTQAHLTHAHEELKQKDSELRKGLDEVQKEYLSLHHTSTNPLVADLVKLVDKRNKIREKEAEVMMVTAQLTLFIHRPSSLAEDSDCMSVRTDREDSISVASEDSFRPRSGDVFRDHEFVEIKRPGRCSYCKFPIQYPLKCGMECQLCKKRVHDKCSKYIPHCTGESPAKNHKSVSRRSSSSLSIANPRPKEASLQRQSTSSSPASSLTSATPASPGNESALLQQQSTSSSPASSLTSPTPASPGNKSGIPTAYPNPFILPKSASIPEQEITPIRDKIVSTTRCEECARLKDELQEVKQRLYIELNAEIRKYQGDSKSADQIGTEYYNFFKDDILDMVWGVQNKTEPREQLCIIFQTIYSQVIKCVVRCATEKLNGLFEVPEEVAVDEATVNDMTRAYARLLSAANLTESQLTTEIQSHVASEISEELMQVSGISQAKMEHFVKRAISVAWSLVTAVPPLISSCDELTFRDDLHEKSSQWVDDRTDYKLKYTRPVLYTNSLGAVTLKGSVRNAEP